MEFESRPVFQCQMPIPKCQIFRIEFAPQRCQGRRENSPYYLSREVPGTNNKPLPISLFLCDLSVCGEPGFWICEDQVAFMMMLQMMLAAWSPRSAALLRCL
jgi:hypothetical protein